MRVRILGCGTSSGVPRIGNDWGDCDPGEPRNRRRRVSILVEHQDVNILVDTGPDLREQLLEARVTGLDAVIWTHDHADHCHGIDDLRQVYHAQGAPVAGFARRETLDTLLRRFGYIFRGKGEYPPVATANLLADALPIGPLSLRIVDQPHGAITAAGIRFDAGQASVGYSTDVNALTKPMIELFRGVDVWIVDALRKRPHPSHASLSETLDWISVVQPKRAILTHMDQSMDYRTLVGELPDGVEPGYDGQEIML